MSSKRNVPVSPRRIAAHVSLKTALCWTVVGAATMIAADGAVYAKDKLAQTANSMTADRPVSSLMATKAEGNTDPTGATGPLSARGKALSRAPMQTNNLAVTMYACLEMDYDNTNNAMWVIDAKGTLSGAQYTIASATVHGAICDSPNWSVTGTLGSSENIVGLNTTPPSFDPGCNRKITIKGSLQGLFFWQGPVPPTTIGTTSGYNFPSMWPNQWFPQTTHLRSFSLAHQICQ